MKQTQETTDWVEEDDRRWEKLQSRESDASFLYAVVTTGIYCRSGCRSRLPRRENVRFFENAHAAAAAGFRACRRCRPDQPDRDATRSERAIHQACSLLDDPTNAASLADLATATGYSPAYFQRLFKRTTGVSPHEYRSWRLRERMLKKLKQGDSVTSAAQAAGYDMNSHFYGDAKRLLGMSPGEYRSGAAGKTIRYAIQSCQLGRILVAMTTRGVCAIELGDTDDDLRASLSQRFHRAELLLDESVLQSTEKVIDYVDSARPPRLSLPIDIMGTAFQQRVWKALQDIPSGETRTYGQLAQQLGAPNATRAIGTACGANPLAVVVPCHRVLRKDGSLGGYRWGLSRKRQLLQRESLLE